MLKDEKAYDILVIEDNEGDYALIADYLADKIARPMIHRARNFGEGKHFLMSGKAALDVILLDLSLPDKSGTALVGEISALSADTPVIVLTGYSDMSFSVRSLSMGASDYLLKDELSPDALYKSIRYSIERRRSFIELRSSEKRYSDLFHLSPQPMWVDELHTLNFLSVNAAAVETYGYSVEEFLSMSVFDIIPPEDTDTVRQAAALRGQPGQIARHGIFTHVKKDGTPIRVEVQSNIIDFRGGKARVVLANDVTERINYISAVELQNKRLREIAWAQSHLVRAPLTRMMGVIDLIRNYGHRDINREELLESLMTSARELDNLIREISGKAERINLNDRQEE